MVDAPSTAPRLDPFRIEYQAYPTAVTEAKSILAYKAAQTAIVMVMSRIVTPRPTFYRATGVRQADPEVINTRSIPTLRCRYPARRNSPRRPAEYFLLDRGSIGAKTRLQKRGTMGSEAIRALLNLITKSGIEDLNPGANKILRGALKISSAGTLEEDFLNDRSVALVPTTAAALMDLVEPFANRLTLGISGGRLLPAISISRLDFDLTYGDYLGKGERLGSST